ncbi:MAG: cytochrome-c peroxidase [Limisphaerales bacterium]
MILAIFFVTSPAIHSQEAGVIDLFNLANYANQPVPSYITKDNTTRGNQITDLGATLGRVLFHDRRLSVDDTISCASCHQQANAFGDVAQASTGVAGTTGRHSPRLINARFGNEDSFFWDERADTLETQATMPIQDHVEMGFSGANGDPGFADLIVKLSTIEEYQVLFSGVFGDATITEERVQLALAQFIRSIQSFDSKYDVGRAQVAEDLDPFPNFTESENAGKSLFLTPRGSGARSARCNGCHRAPEFDISPNSQGNGIVGTIGGGVDDTVTRSPTLRDMFKTDGTPNGPFMHNGALTIREVIEHYNAIPDLTPNLDQRLIRNGQPLQLNLTEQEKLDLEAFLKTLSGTNVYTDPKWSDPFDSQGQLNLIVMPANQVAVTKVTDRARVDITMPAVPNTTYQVESSADLVTWCDTENGPAVGLYQAEGFVPCEMQTIWWRRLTVQDPTD